jgi:hypothetical protein
LSVTRERNRRLWKLDFKEDASKAYSVKWFANGRLDVLANGKRVATAPVRATFPDDDDERMTFHVERGWLIARTYPGHAASARALRARATEQRTTRAAATRAPSFRSFIAALEKELGRAERRKRCDTNTWVFAAPNDGRVRVLYAEARAFGGACTLTGDNEDELVVVSGGTARLTPLLDWNLYGPGSLEPAFAALDADAEMTFEAIHDHWMRVALARVPSDVAHHAHMLSTEIGVQSEAKIAASLRKKKFELQF